MSAERVAGVLRRHGRPVGKTLLVPALVGLTAGAPRYPGSRCARAAQAFSWGGDVALTRPGRVPFLLGLGSFLAAHVAYVAAYRARSSVPVLASPGRRRVLAAGTTAASAMALVASRSDPVVALPVAAYGVTLTTMLTAAAAVDRDRGRGRLVVGASLFLLSDTLIGVRRFVLGDRSRRLDNAVLVTYAGAQWVIADALRRP